MALKLIKNDPAEVFAALGYGGLAAPEPLALYIRVESASGSEHLVRCHVSITDAASGYASSTHAEFPPAAGNGDFVAQAYEHLKTLPEFADAEDC